MPKVLIADELSPAAVAALEERGVAADVRTGLGEGELVQIIGDYEGLAVRSATKVSAGLLAAGTRLKVVGRAGIGVDNIDLAAATQRGVVVMNTPFGNSVTTAEHTIAMMLALARQLPAADRSTRSGKWEKSRFVGTELADKVLGLIGCGNIGTIVADRAHGLKMRVIASDPYLSPERAADLGVEKVDLDALLGRADVISLHTPLTETTRHILDARALARTRPGVRIINCARGGLVDEAALYEAIRSGHVAGAALDVFAEEPARASPLFELDQVVVTPHLGAATAEAQEKVALQIAAQMADYLTTGAVANALNMAPLSAEESPRLAPYMRLADQLGSFAGQLTETGLRAASITYAGQVAHLNTTPLTATVLRGLLAPVMASVNMVNAPLVARERDIAVTTIHQEQTDGYLTLIRLTVEAERGPRSVAGTLFHERSARIVAIRGIEIEAQLGPHMLYVRNVDKPGLIGALGQLLGDAGVNIATFHLGRERPGGDAIALIEVDQPVPEAILQAICALPHVVQCKALRF
ncbi:MAG: phosphoglycerate dehydrogenase [Geminicoccaceae bacterium]|nr:phosphoglycerate dehydrogenase [Geminicoccaceae bacterium]